MISSNSCLPIVLQFPCTLGATFFCIIVFIFFSNEFDRLEQVGLEYNESTSHEEHVMVYGSSPIAST
jgi:hypothetical protein